MRDGNAVEVGRNPGVAPVEKAKPEGKKITSLQNHIFAARGEKAIWKVVPFLSWHKFSTKGFHNSADVGDFIDGKATDYPIEEIEMIVKRDYKDGDKKAIHPEFAYTLAAGFHHPWWYIAGWMWGREVIQRYKPKKYYSWVYQVPEKDLHPIDELIEIARDRVLSGVAVNA